MRKKIIVVGAGVGGLATAIRLQSKGYEVEIFEKESMVGGKMHQIEGNGFKFDLGPTIVMMPQIYNEVFEVAGKDPKDYIPMENLDPVYSLTFDDGKRVSVSTDLVKLTKFLEEISYEEAQGYMSYLADVYKRYLVAKDHFIEKSFRGPKDFYNPKTLRQALKLKTFDSAYHSISKYVKDDKLRKLLSFQTLYIGISPYNGPSIYTIIPMIEMVYGVWFIKGGMYTMAKSMEKLFIELGGKINLNSSIDEIVIEDGKAVGIKLNSKEIKADSIVCNADFPYAMKNLIKEEKYKGKYTDKKIDKMKYSCSCFLMYLGLKEKLEDFEVHNIFFAKDFDKNISDIFDGILPDDPSIYLYLPTKVDASLAPEGKECLYVLVPIPELSRDKIVWNDETIANYRSKILEIIKDKTKIDNFEDLIEFERIVTPKDFEGRFNAYNGATFGLAPTLFQSNYYRPHNKASHCENLYFVGSSVHPGAGVPIVLTSAKLTANEVMKDDGII